MPCDILRGLLGSWSEEGYYRRFCEIFRKDLVSIQDGGHARVVVEWTLRLIGGGDIGAA